MTETLTILFLILAVLCNAYAAWTNRQTRRNNRETRQLLDRQARLQANQRK